MVSVGEFIPKVKWEEFVDSAQYEVSKATGSPTSVSFSPDGQTLDVVLYDEISAAGSASPLATTRSVVAQSIDRIADGVSVRVKVSQRSAQEMSGPADGVMRGGGYLTYSDTSRCTAGFLLRSNGGAIRLGAAGHCVSGRNAAEYRLHWTEGGDITSTQAMWTDYSPGAAGSYDIGYHSTGSFNPYPSFYAAPGLKRGVDGAASSRYDVGASVCFLGGRRMTVHLVAW